MRFCRSVHTVPNYLHSIILLSATAFVLQTSPCHAQRDGTPRRSGDSTSAEGVRTVSTSGVVITAQRPAAVAPMPEVLGTSLFSGMKAEEIRPSQTGCNLAVNNTRQMFSRTAGVHVWEFDGSGLQANIASRGLNPHRSSEFNVRMNGYDIASDPYGYPEAHFTPPFESLERIEVVRGAASLQYGPQFGGLLNYVTKAPPADRPLAVEATLFAGSYGLASTYASAAGTIDGFNYGAYVNYRRSDGWRASSGYNVITAHAQTSWRLPNDARLGIEVTGMDFTEHMPNGLTEAQYAADPRAAYRPRDWFGAPRIMPALTYDQKLSETATLSVKASGLVGDRNSITLVSSTSIADTGTNRRRVNRDLFADAVLEPRLLLRFAALGDTAALATGLRVARSSTARSQGRGFDGTDFNLEYNGQKTLDLKFATWNPAAFAQIRLPIAPGLALVPGVRVEHITTSATGIYAREKSAISAEAFDTLGAITTIDRNFSETFPLFGLGASASLPGEMTLYGNITQAYRPLLYAQQFPYDQIPVDSAITSSKGFSSDVGVRGPLGSVGSFEVNGFLIEYGDRVGIVRPDSVRYPNGLRTNAGASRHYGFESCANIDILGLVSELSGTERSGALVLSLSAGYTNAMYTDGPAKDKEVENSPDWIASAGLTWRLGSLLSATAQARYVSACFSDAANTVYRADGQQGIIPEYTVVDFSADVRAASFLHLRAGVNNVLDRKYFTARATAYPGPGILPGDGRTFTAGVQVDL